MLITVMSERELHVPRLGRVVADPGLPAGRGDEPVRRRRHGAHLQRRVRPRVPAQRRLPVGRRGGGDRRAGRRRRPTPAWVERDRRARPPHPRPPRPARRLVGARRARRDRRRVVAGRRCASSRSTTPSVGLDAVLVALSGRVRLREGCLRTSRGDHHRAVGRGLRRRPPGRRRRRRRRREKPRPRRGPPLPEGGAAGGRGHRRRQALDDVAARRWPATPSFDQVSPEVGELDEAAFDDAMAEDADEAMALLADMTRATDAGLRELARRLAGRLVLDVARRGPARPRGQRAHRRRAVPARRRRPRHRRQHRGDRRGPGRRGRRSTPSGCASGGGSSRAPRCACSSTAAGRWAASRWRRTPSPRRRWRSGRRTTSASCRSPRTRSSSSRRTSPTPVEAVVDGVLALRGHGTTDLAGALAAAGQQLARSSAGRKITVLLSDCRATEPGDVRRRRRRARRAGDRRPRRRRRRRRGAGQRRRRRAHDGRRPDRRRRRPVRAESWPDRIGPRRRSCSAGAIAPVRRGSRRRVGTSAGPGRSAGDVAGRDDAERVLGRARRLGGGAVAAAGGGRRRRRVGRRRPGAAARRTSSVGSKTCSGASASDVSPRNIASTACMLSPSIRGSSTAAPLIVAADGLDLVRGDRRRARRRCSTPANSISLASDSPASVTTSPPVAGSIRPPATLGLSRPLASTLDSVRRRKSCWREMRPRSDVGSSLPVAAARRVLVLVVARAHVGQGVVAVEREAAGRPAR